MLTDDGSANFCTLATFQRLTCECAKILGAIAKKHIPAGNNWHATSPIARKVLIWFEELAVALTSEMNFTVKTIDLTIALTQAITTQLLVMARTLS